MIAIRIILAATAVCFAGCGVIGGYQFNAPTFSESIELRRDHTFTYGCESDVIGDGYYAKGTWALDKAGLLVTTVASAEGASHSCLQEIQRWKVTSRGLTAEGSNDLLRRDSWLR